MSIILQRDFGRGFAVRVSLEHLVHGYLTPNGHLATLIVMNFKCETFKSSARIREAEIELEFVGNGNSGQYDANGPEARQMEPEGAQNFSMLPRLPGTAKTQFTICGMRLLKREAHGASNAVKWSIREDEHARCGIPSTVTVAVLLERYSDEPFQMITSIRNDYTGFAFEKGQPGRRMAANQVITLKPSEHLMGIRLDRIDSTSLKSYDLKQFVLDGQGWRQLRMEFRGKFARFFFKDGPKRLRIRIYIYLATRICERGLEGFGGGMLAFASLKPNINTEAARWGIGAPAFTGIMVPALFKVFPGMDPGNWDEFDKVLEEFKRDFACIGGANVLDPNKISSLHVRNAAETLLDVIGSLTGVLWNMAAGNGLVQNGYIGLISCTTASASILLSLRCCLYSFNKLDGKFLPPDDPENQKENQEKLRKEVGKFQYLIVAPILVGVICAFGSVLGAAYLFGNSGDAEFPEDRDAERNDYPLNCR